MTGFKFTDDQRTALVLIGGVVRNLLLFGGSRSGKTFILLFSIVVRVLKAPGSRHAVFRFRHVHIRHAVLFDSFPKLMKLCFPGIEYISPVSGTGSSDSGTARKSGSSGWTTKAGRTKSWDGNLPRYTLMKGAAVPATSVSALDLARWAAAGEL